MATLSPSSSPPVATPLAVEVAPILQEVSAPAPEQEQTEAPVPETPPTPPAAPSTARTSAPPSLILPAAPTVITPQVAPQTFAIIPQPARTISPVQAFAILPQPPGAFDVLPPQATVALGQQNPTAATYSFLPQNYVAQPTIRLLQPALRLPQVLQAPVVPVAVRPAPTVQDFPAGLSFALAPLAPRLPPLPLLQAFAAAQPATPQSSRLPQLPIFQTISAPQPRVPQPLRLAPQPRLQVLPSQPTALQETVTSPTVTPATTQRPILQYTGVTLPYRTTGTPYYELQRH